MKAQTTETVLRCLLIACLISHIGITNASDIRTNLTVEAINEHNVKDINSDNFYQMLQNSPIISKEHITNLWTLLTSAQIDNQVKILFYDFISFEHPDYLTNDIIKQAKKEHGEARHKLLVIL